MAAGAGLKTSLTACVKLNGCASAEENVTESIYMEQLETFGGRTTEHKIKPMTRQ